jgi:predicted nucleic acid-binding protein
VSGPFVVDASVAIAWVHPAQATAETDEMLASLAGGAVLEVPAVWPLEVANALLVLARRRKLRELERESALRWLCRLPVVIDPDGASAAFTRLSELAARHALSVYDAAYLELAQRRRLPLGCRDRALRDAAAACGVEVW